jgi:hypothetical protein
MKKFKIDPDVQPQVEIVPSKTKGKTDCLFVVTA